MKLVIQTQFRENYGAHDWDGTGECPQYWKSKGGETFIVDVTLEEAQSPAFWSAVEKCIEHKSDYSAEYIIHEQLVDDCDFVESNHIEEWESATYCMLLSDRPQLACRKLQMSYNLDPVPVGERTWLQDENGATEMSYNTFEKEAA